MTASLLNFAGGAISQAINQSTVLVSPYTLIVKLTSCFQLTLGGSPNFSLNEECKYVVEAWAGSLQDESILQFCELWNWVGAGSPILWLGVENFGEPAPRIND